MVGQTISHFKILDKLGEGGMGVVYKAQDTKLDRLVALKFLPSNLTRNPDAKARFVHEARAASALQHDNICAIHDIVDTDDGEMFIVMDYYEGESLENKLSRGPANLDEVVSIAVQVAGGLAKAHEKGIVHRDIKPANIFITSSGTAKILDFGVAKLAGSETRLTKEGSTVGTAAYMSPEQIRGEEADRRADIFSFGAVLYELITGQRPFKGAHEAALAYEIVYNDPAPIDSLRTGVSSELQFVVKKMLEKDVTVRYQNADDIARDLRSIEKGIRIDHEIIVTQLRHSWRSHKVRVSLAVAIAAACALVIYFSLYQTDTSRLTKSLAVLYVKNLGPESDDAYCYGITQDLIVDITNSGPVRVAPMKDVLNLRDSNFTIESTARRLRVRYVMESSFRREGDTIRLTANIVDVNSGNIIWGNRFQARSTEASSIQAGLVQGIITTLTISPTSAVLKQITARKTDNPEAYEYYLRAKYIFEKKKGKEDVVIARGLFEKALALDSGFTAAYIGFGDTYEVQGEYDVARQIYEKSLSIAQANGQKIDEAGCLGRIARVYWQRRDQQKALDYYQRSLTAYEELGNLSGESSILNGMANIYHNQGNSDKALETYKRALEIAKKLQDRSTEALLVGNIAIVYTDLGEYAEALASYNKSLFAYEELEDRVSISRTAFNMGELFRRLGETEKALQQVNCCLDISRSLGVKFGETVSLGVLGAVYSDEGHYEKAFEYLEPAIAMSKQLGARSLEASCKTFLGVALTRKGEFNRSEQVLKEAVLISDEIGDTPGVLWATSWLGVAQIGMNERNDARRSTEKVIGKLTSDPKPDEFVQINWNLSKIYSFLAEDEPASRYLKVARQEVEARAQKISDVVLRESYLHKVKENREIMAAWELLKNR